MRRLTPALLTLLLASGCGGEPVEVEIPFLASYGDEALACEGPADLELTDLRFYASELRLVAASGAEARLQLYSDGRWQQSDLAMLDLETGRGACVNGTAETNFSLTGTVPADDYVGLRFVLGVPFDRNHGDPLRAEAPLGDAAMHWHWRGGYKFLRAGLRKGNDGFWLHLGSTGCSGRIGAITECTAPNRVAVELTVFDPWHDAVRVDMAALFTGIDLSDGVAGDCSSSPAESTCRAPFAALGLAGATQTVFSRQPRQ